MSLAGAIIARIGTQTRWSPRFKPYQLKTKPRKSVGKPVRRRAIVSAAILAALPNPYPPAKARPGRQNHGIGRDPAVPGGQNTTAEASRRSVIHIQPLYNIFQNGQVGRMRNHGLHARGILALRTLYARRAHGDAAARIQGFRLQGRRIGIHAHFTAKSIKFIDKMALRKPPDSRIARHLGDGGRLGGDKQRIYAHSRRRKRRLAPGMTAPDDDNAIPPRRDSVKSRFRLLPPAARVLRPRNSFARRFPRRRHGQLPRRKSTDGATHTPSGGIARRGNLHRKSIRGATYAPSGIIMRRGIERHRSIGRTTFIPPGGITRRGIERHRSTGGATSYPSGIIARREIERHRSTGGATSSPPGGITRSLIARSKERAGTVRAVRRASHGR